MPAPRISEAFIPTSGRKLSDAGSFDLRGIDTTTPFDVLPPNRSPFLRNARMYAQKENDRQVAISTRKGAGFYTAPVGQAADDKNLNTTTEVTTNYVTNPSFETNLTSWSATGGATLSRVTSGGAKGSSYMKVAGSAGVGTTHTTANVGASTEHYVSVYISQEVLPGITASAVVTVEVSHNGTVLSSENFTTEDPKGAVWSRYSTSVTTTSATGVGLVITLTAVTVAYSNFIVDAVSATNSSSLLDYFDGSTVDTESIDYDWTGTAHASTSTRTQTTVVGTNTDREISQTKWQAVPFTPTTTGRLTRATFNLKKNTGTGALMVEVRTNNSSGEPGDVLATSSIDGSVIPSTYELLSTRFIDAPELESGVTYWFVLYNQDDNSGIYNIGSNATSTTSLVSTTSGNSWTATDYELIFESFLSTDGAVKGVFRFDKSDAPAATLFVHGTDLYSVNEDTGVITSEYSSFDASASYYEFAFADDKTFIANRVDAPTYWDGTNVSIVGGSPPTASMVALHKNRLFWVSATDPTRIEFSDIGDYETYEATSFIYVPAPKTSDPITGIVSFQDTLVVFTRNTKYVLYGSSLSNFVLRQAIGKKGAVAASAITTDGNFIYFLSDDNVYAYSGSQDEPMGDRVLRNLSGIPRREDCFLQYHDRKIRMYYPLSGQGSNSHMLLWDFSLGEPEIFIDNSAYIKNSVVDESGRLIEASDRVGQLYLAEQQNSILGKPIDFAYHTPYFSFGQQASKKRVKRLYPFLRSSTRAFTTSIKIDKDFEDIPVGFDVAVQGSGYILGDPDELLGDFTIGKTELINPRITVPGDAQYYQARFEQSGVDTGLDIIGYSMYYRMRRPK